MLTIVIKNQEINFKNANLPLGKSEICFELLTQKREIGKNTADALY